MGYRERLNKVRTKTDQAWLSRTIGYPLGWRFVALFGDVQIITPNLLTWLGSISIVAASVLFCFQNTALDIIAAGLLLIHLVFDCADGTLARYRGTSSALGAFLDKAGDALGMLFLSTAAGIRAFLDPGPFFHSPWIVAAGALGGGFFVIVCYIYWVVAYYEQKALNRNQNVVPESMEHKPQPMDLKEELRFILRAQPLIFSFNEGDFTLWAPLLILLGRADILVGLFFITQGATMAKMLIVRGRAMSRLDKREVSNG